LVQGRGKSLLARRKIFAEKKGKRGPRQGTLIKKAVVPPSLRGGRKKIPAKKEIPDISNPSEGKVHRDRGKKKGGKEKKGRERSGDPPKKSTSPSGGRKKKKFFGRRGDNRVTKGREEKKKKP